MLSPEFSLTALLALLAVTVSNLQYIRSILKRETRPSLAAMLVFVVSLGSALAASRALGASPLVLGTILANLALNTVALLLVVGRKLGHTRFTHFEKTGLVAVAASNLVWWASGDAWTALIAPTLVDATGLWMVVRKLHQDPGSEDTFAWVLVAFAYGLALAGLPEYTLQNTLYAGVNFVLCGYIGLLTGRQRRQARLSPS